MRALEYGVLVVLLFEPIKALATVILILEERLKS